MKKTEKLLNKMVILKINKLNGYKIFNKMKQ